MGSQSSNTRELGESPCLVIVVANRATLSTENQEREKAIKSGRTPTFWIELGCHHIRRQKPEWNYWPIGTTGILNHLAALLGLVVSPIFGVPR